jgi:hypothetical protein
VRRYAVRSAVLLFIALVLSALVLAQPALTFPPPKTFPPDEAMLKEIKEKTEALRAAIKKEKIDDPDILIFLKAAEYIVRHKEWYGKQARMTVEVLDEGIKRAGEWKKLVAGKKEVERRYPWKAGEINVGAYRSGIDGSIQPFAVTLPADIAKRKNVPLHVVLHGRNGGLTEVSFLRRAMKGKAPAGLDHVILDIYGRGNNAYRWAGETDVFEAMAACETRPEIKGRLGAKVLRGFSMGGAGAWHIGLHHPDRFNVVGPGAGFTTTHGYVPRLGKLPAYQEACLHIYDAVDYAENAFNVPIVAYSGEDDAQKAAADNIEKALTKLGLKMTHLISPKTKHTIPPAYQKRLAEEYAKYSKEPRPKKGPDNIRFVTYTLQYANCEWVTILRMGKMYAKARVEAERAGNTVNLKTENVEELLVEPTREDKPITVVIDGQKLKVHFPNPLRYANIRIGRVKGKWEHTPFVYLDYRRKSASLHGPIDHAFMQSFVCVRGTGKPWNTAVQAYADASLKRFRDEWSKYMRGDIPVIDDIDLPKPQYASKHLILFGDPGSNSAISAEMENDPALSAVPFRWTKRTITWNGKEYDAATHVPVLIRPARSSHGNYTVLNSGHTFHAKDFEGTNALLYPRLGDWALLKIKDAKKPLDVEVVTAGLFDEEWKFPK